ncbi:MAG: DUF4198 domain-containing protein [Pseudomonadota bacterium]
MISTMGFASLAGAHEYYLLPETFSPKAGQSITVSHKLGQKFFGNEMPWVDHWNVRSELWHNGTASALKGTLGDRPALKIGAVQPGLSIVVHQSNVDFITFKEWEKFKAYVEKEGLTGGLAPSLEGRKPMTDLREGYSRFAKTLVYSGTPQEQAAAKDQATGLKIELVALDNPTTLAADEALRVQALYEGKPYQGGQVTVFVGTKTEVAHRIITDENGIARIPAGGPGPYLLNIIKMTDPQSKEAQDEKAHWESFWASLTFQRAG